MAMANTILLIINVGSTSNKYALYRLGEFDNTCLYQDTKKNIQEFLASAHEKNYIKEYSEIESIAFRIVAPGTWFTENRYIDDIYTDYLTTALPQAPLHIQATLNHINQLKIILPHAHNLGISDSAFHVTLLPEARFYAIPLHDSHTFDLYRFGYHGLSIQSIIHFLDAHQKTLKERIVVCHLGGGTSITALYQGKSIDTSMGYTPDEGVPMETRAGSIGIGALKVLAQQKQMSLMQLEKFINEQCGIVNLSHSFNDMKAIFEEAYKGNISAQFSLNLFMHYIIKQIAGAGAVLKGIDHLVLTGGISEHNPSLVLSLQKSLSWLNIPIIEVIPSQEMNEIARQAHSILIPKKE